MGAEWDATRRARVLHRCRCGVPGSAAPDPPPEDDSPEALWAAIAEAQAELAWAWQHPGSRRDPEVAGMQGRIAQPSNDYLS